MKTDIRLATQIRVVDPVIYAGQTAQAQTPPWPR
jgi:hypothetical protein